MHIPTTRFGMPTQTCELNKGEKLTRCGEGRRDVIREWRIYTEPRTRNDGAEELEMKG